MVSSKTYQGTILLSISFAQLLFSCSNSPTSNSNTDSALNGTWADGTQAGASKVYITELTFNNGNFEWTWDEDLQQRGVYDTKDGVLTITIKNNYGSPQRLLGDYSSNYSVKGDTLIWGGSKYAKK